MEQKDLLALAVLRKQREISSCSCFWLDHSNYNNQLSGKTIGRANHADEKLQLIHRVSNQFYVGKIKKKQLRGKGQTLNQEC